MPFLDIYARAFRFRHWGERQRGAEEWAEIPPHSYALEIRGAGGSLTIERSSIIARSPAARRGSRVRSARYVYMSLFQAILSEEGPISNCVGIRVYGAL